MKLPLFFYIKKNIVCGEHLIKLSLKAAFVKNKKNIRSLYFELALPIIKRGLVIAIV